jgi:hypothetical protein
MVMTGYEYETLGLVTMAIEQAYKSVLDDSLRMRTDISGRQALIHGYLSHFLQSLQANRKISEFSVMCDDAINTPSLRSLAFADTFCGLGTIAYIRPVWNRSGVITVVAGDYKFVDHHSRQSIGV